MRTLLSVLVPLLVVGVFVGIAARVAGRPRQQLEEQAIVAAWYLAQARPADRSDAVAGVERYLEDFGDRPEAPWFAARALLELQEPVRAIDVVWGPGGAGAEAGAERRFADLVVRSLGFEDEDDLQGPTVWASNALLLLCDAGEPQALARLDRIVTEEMQGAFLSAFPGIFLFASRATRERFATVIRSRGEHEAHVIAAMVGLGHVPYEEREADVARLLDILRSPMRREEPLVWALAAQALGRSGEDEALEALAEARGTLEASGDPRDAEDAAFLATALLAGGRWAALDALADQLVEVPRQSPSRMWMALAVIHRLRLGDPEAPRAFGILRDSLRRQPDPILLSRIGYEILLRDEEVPGDWSGLLADLEAPDAQLGAKAVAAAARHRRGEAGGRDALLDVLRTLAEQGWFEKDPSVTSILVLSPLVVATRALLLPHSDSSAH